MTLTEHRRDILETVGSWIGVDFAGLPQKEEEDDEDDNEDGEAGEDDPEKTDEDDDDDD